MYLTDGTSNYGILDDSLDLVGISWDIFWIILAEILILTLRRDVTGMMLSFTSTYRLAMDLVDWLVTPL